MTRALAIYLGAALMAAWAILRAWDHVRGRPAPEPWVEPEDGVQPADPYVVTLARDDPRVGMYSRN